MHMASKHPTEELRTKAELVHVVTGHTVNHLGFGGFRNQTWALLCQQYSDKIDPSKAEGEGLKVPAHVPTQMEVRNRKPMEYDHR